MIYIPKQKTAEQLLELTGFTTKHRGSRGWVRDVFSDDQKSKTCVVIRASEKRSRELQPRLHAIIRTGGLIDLHMDVTPEPGVHKTRRFSKRIHDCLREFQGVDV